MKRTKRATGGSTPAEILSSGGKQSVRSGRSPGLDASNGAILSTRSGKSPGLGAAQDEILAKRMKTGGSMGSHKKAHASLHSLYKVLHHHFGGGREPESERASGGKLWVQNAFSKNKGALHRELNVPQGKKIPLNKLHKAEHSKSPKLRKRAQLAETSRGFNHKPQGR